MSPITRPRVSYANVTATLALFFALGGGAFAAATLPARSVGPAQLKKDAVVRIKIKNNAVNGSKVLDGSLTGADVNEASLAKVPGALVADNATHAAAAGALDKVSYRTATGTAAAGAQSTSATAVCDAGQHVIGGGVRVDDPVNAFVDDSFPDAAGTAWTSRVANGGGAAMNFTVFAICTTAAAVG